MNKSLHRTGMTLMEIMMSVMILGLGLLGILSVIPFIEYHSGRVLESDYVAAAGKNAMAIIRARQWEKPATWAQYQRQSGALQSIDENGTPIIATDEDGILQVNEKGIPFDENGVFLPIDEKKRVIPTGNFIYPRFLDIFGDHSRDGQGFPNWYIGLGTDSILGDVAIPHVFPAGTYSQDPRSQDICRSQDDVVYERDENSQNRPQLLLDETGNTNRPEFTGAYSWAALMTPIEGDPSQSYANFTFPHSGKTVNNGTPQAEVSMEVDVLVFRGRDFVGPYDYLVGNVSGISGNGYAGGLVEINCAAPSEFEKSLDSSTYILLIGPSDQSALNGDTTVSALWYKIANYTRNGRVFSVTLTGATTPACWIPNENYDRSGDVRAVLFRNLRGVFTQTFPVTEPE